MGDEQEALLKEQEEALAKMKAAVVECLRTDSGQKLSKWLKNVLTLVPFNPDYPEKQIAFLLGQQYLAREILALGNQLNPENF